MWKMKIYEKCFVCITEVCKPNFCSIYLTSELFCCSTDGCRFDEFLGHEEWEVWTVPAAWVPGITAVAGAGIP